MAKGTIPVADIGDLYINPGIQFLHLPFPFLPLY
jgi:hypothetical protein